MKGMKDEDATAGCAVLQVWSDFRQSRKLAAVSFFLAVFTDAMTIALVMSLAPSIVRSYNFIPCNCTLLPNNVTEKAALFGLEGNGTRGNRWEKFIALDQQPQEHFCSKSGNISDCRSGEDILIQTSSVVDLLNAVGPISECLFNPLVGILCSKYGHRLPFLAGAAAQTVSSLALLFASSEIHLVVARGVQGVSSSLVVISGLLMVNNVFEEETRVKVISRALGLGLPLANLFAFSVGNALYQYGGTLYTFSILVGLAGLDGLLRLILNTEKHEKKIHESLSGDESHTVSPDSNSINTDKEDVVNLKKNGSMENTALFNGPHKDQNGFTIKDTELLCAGGSDEETSPTDKHQLDRHEGSYLELLSDIYVIEALTVSFTEGCFLYVVFATAPNWSINVLNAQQWELGVVLAVGAGFQVLCCLLTGGFMNRRNIWAHILTGIIAMIGAIVIYPFIPSIWFALIPEAMLRGLTFNNQLSGLPNFLSYVMEDRHKHSVAKGFSLFNLSYNIGNGIGPFAGNLLRYIGFKELYFITAGISGLILLIPIHWRISGALRH